MSFDFDTVINRAASDSQKWQKYAGTDIIPLWVADMDFAAPPPVIEALHERVRHGVFGYSKPQPSQTQAVVEYCARRYGWMIEPSWIVWLPGLVTALNVSATAFGEPGDEVLCTTPIYPPFLTAPANQRRRAVPVPLVKVGGRWVMDFDALERAVTPRTRQLFLCSPHNPVARAYTRAELERLADFCARHKLIVTSDEIHCDLILNDTPHVPFATLHPEVAARSITLMAPSKTYNVPGLATAFAIIPDAVLRATFNRAAAGTVPDANVLGLVACEAALRHGEPWRQELIRYLRGNADLIAATVRDLPGVSMTPVEATYLAWIDVSALGLEAPGRYFEEHGLGFADGTTYSAPAGTHIRLNFGCPRATLTEALARFRRAVAAVRR